jgi:histone-lysine N-methyltransferase SUV420H
MNMRDLSKDDDFLSHLLVEKLGTGTVPLLVHKMDPSRRLPKTDACDLLAIVRRVSPVFSPFFSRLIFSCHARLAFFCSNQLVASKGPIQHVIRQAVDELLMCARHSSHHLITR